MKICPFVDVYSEEAPPDVSFTEDDIGDAMPSISKSSPDAPPAKVPWQHVSPSGGQGIAQNPVLSPPGQPMYGGALQQNPTVQHPVHMSQPGLLNPHPGLQGIAGKTLALCESLIKEKTSLDPYALVKISRGQCSHLSVACCEAYYINK